jgi:hypothetical protein
MKKCGSVPRTCSAESSRKRRLQDRRSPPQSSIRLRGGWPGSSSVASTRTHGSAPRLPRPSGASCPEPKCALAFLLPNTGSTRPRCRDRSGSSWGFRALHRRTELCRPLVGSIPKHGATHTKGRAHDANRQPYDASRARSRVSRHWRKPFFGNDLTQPMTRMTRNRGPFPGGGCGGDQT